MNQPNKQFASILGAVMLGLVGVAPAANAATWGNSSCGASSCTTTTVDGVSATVKAFSAQVMTTAGAYTTSNAFAASTSLTYSNGYGYQVQAPGGDTSSPNHSIDNFGYLDVVLMQFSSAVTLKELKLGWSQYDSDVTVMAYMGDTSSGNAAASIAGKTVSQLPSSTGWKLVSNEQDVGSTSTTASTATNQVATFNDDGSYSSSWWLVSAFNSTLGGVTNPTTGSVSGLTMGNITSKTNNVYNNVASNWDNGYDFVKLASVSGFKTPPPPNETPEPGTLVLAGVAMFALLRTNGTRRKHS